MDILNDKSILSAIMGRKTSRNFNGESVSIDTLSVVLFSCFGEIHGKDWKELSDLKIKQFGIRKSSPSATGLQSCSAYVCIFNVEGLEDGIYHYIADDHSLRKIKEGMNDDLMCQYVCDQFWAKGFAFGIFIVVNMEKVWIKDKQVRAFPIAFAEAGHFSQTVQLVSVALDLNTWITGSFRDEMLCQDLGITNKKSFPCFFVGIGHGTGHPIPEEIQKILTA